MYCSAKDVAGRLGVSRDAVYAWARKGQLPGAVRIGGTLRIDDDELSKFLRSGGALVRHARVLRPELAEDNLTVRREGNAFEHRWLGADKRTVRDAHPYSPSIREVEA
ncbi:MAG TPA: helix-turn-helix domain-containing protein [Bryobacteraceae bacterium]|nr:helix-turn-helix domain-containing protein [Bryobacteraceae bacterium]